MDFFGNLLCKESHGVRPSAEQFRLCAAICDARSHPSIVLQLSIFIRRSHGNRFISRLALDRSIHSASRTAALLS